MSAQDSLQERRLEQIVLYLAREKGIDSAYKIFFDKFAADFPYFATLLLLGLTLPEAQLFVRSNAMHPHSLNKAETKAYEAFFLRCLAQHPEVNLLLSEAMLQDLIRQAKVITKR